MRNDAKGQQVHKRSQQQSSLGSKRRGFWEELAPQAVVALTVPILELWEIADGLEQLRSTPIIEVLGKRVHHGQFLGTRKRLLSVSDAAVMEHTSFSAPGSKRVLSVSTVC